jgi:hypothetical protein
MWHSITQTAERLPDPLQFLVLAPIPSNRYPRSLEITSAVMVVALLNDKAGVSLANLEAELKALQAISRHQCATAS